jgi:hypothetical protein
LAFLTGANILSAMSMALDVCPVDGRVGSLSMSSYIFLAGFMRGVSLMT